MNLNKKVSYKGKCYDICLSIHEKNIEASYFDAASFDLFYRKNYKVKGDTAQDLEKTCELIAEDFKSIIDAREALGKKIQATKDIVRKIEL